VVLWALTNRKRVVGGAIGAVSVAVVAALALSSL
jgi:hypothetical protein